MLETKSKTIGNLEVKVQQFPGRKNLDLLVDLAAFVGPAIGGAVPASGSIMDADIDAEKVVSGLMKNLNSQTVGGLVMRMLGSTFFNDKPVDSDVFDAVFAGANLWVLPKVLAFVIEVNYGNFSELVEIVSGVIGQKQQVKAPVN